MACSIDIFMVMTIICDSQVLCYKQGSIWMFIIVVWLQKVVFYTISKKMCQPQLDYDLGRNAACHMISLLQFNSGQHSSALGMNNNKINSI